MKKVFEGCDIITHGDGDGTFAAAIARLAGATGQVTVTQPFLLHRLGDLSTPTVVLDMAVDSKNSVATIEWARRNGQFIVLWVDHHLGGEGLQEVLGDRFVYDPQAPSCPAVMDGQGMEFPAEWLVAANACDRPAEFSPTPLSERYNAAFKAALVALQGGDRSAVEAVQTAFIAELLGEGESELVSARVREYPEILKATKQAATSYRELAPGVVATSIAEGAIADVTALLFEGYKLAPVAVVQNRGNGGDKITVVATNNRSRNLVDLFGLGSGNPSRIVLSGGDHQSQLARVREVLG